MPAQRVFSGLRPSARMTDPECKPRCIAAKCDVSCRSRPRSALATSPSRDPPGNHRRSSEPPSNLWVLARVSARRLRSLHAESPPAPPRRRAHPRPRARDRRARARGLRLLLLARQLRRPRRRGPGLRAAVRRRGRAPRRHAEDRRDRRREHAHPPARLLRAPRLGAPGARQPAAHLQPRHRAVAGPQRRDLPLHALHLRRGDQPAAAAAHPAPPRRLIDHAERMAVRIGSPGRDRARHQRRRQGSLVHQHRGPARRRARGQLPRRQLPGEHRRRGLRDRRSPRRARHRHGIARRDRHLARRPLARARGGLFEAPRERPARRARPRLLEPHRHGRRIRRREALPGRASPAAGASGGSGASVPTPPARRASTA